MQTMTQLEIKVTPLNHSLPAQISRRTTTPDINASVQATTTRLRPLRVIHPLFLDDIASLADVQTIQEL
jgi:hypothetical protein